MAKLLETYAKRISIAEGVYAREHNNEAMPRDKKIALACVLNNTNRFMNEAFENSVGTQRADIGNYKKFILNLTNIAMPNLIAFDLVMVKPMTSRSGYVTYVEYVAGSNKGGVKQGDVFNAPLGFDKSFGNIDEDRARYTSAAVVEELEANAEPSWKPLKQTTKTEDHFPVQEFDVEKYDGVDSEGKAVWTPVTLTDGKVTAAGKYRYIYDNCIIPQNDLPIINAVTKDIPLIAKARRIAIYYSQMAAFEMKTEMGEDLGQNLSEQAVGELKFEIDIEVIEFLKSLAGAAEISFDKKLPVGVSMAQHYEGFKETLNKMRSELYNRTRRFAPNYMVCAIDVLEVLAFCSGWRAAAPRAVAGAYLAGTIDGLKVFVAPNMEAGNFFVGVNEGMVSAAVYAPYMAIVPTQLLGFADGAMSQGFSTMYALAALNKDLVVAGKVIMTA
jgi:hypothetical protein